MQAVITKYPFARLSAWVIPAAILIAAPALAQTASAQEDEISDEIVELSPFEVSAEGDVGWMTRESSMSNRIARSLLETPGAFTVIGEQMIEDLAATDPMQALKFGAAGVSEKQNISDDMNIRGFRTGGSLRDGIRRQSIGRSPMYDVGRIEVTKGPSALLLGSNEFLGGAVNLITREPSEEKKTSLKATFGSNEYQRYEANTSGPLVKKENFVAAYRATLGGTWGDGANASEDLDEIFIGGALSLKFYDRIDIRLYGYNFHNRGYSYWNDFLDISEETVAVLHPLSTEDWTGSANGDNTYDVLEKVARAEVRVRITPTTSLRVAHIYFDMDETRELIRGLQMASENILDRQYLARIASRTTAKTQLDLVQDFNLGPIKNSFSAGYDYQTSDTRIQDQVHRSSDFPQLLLDVTDPDYSQDYLVRPWVPRRDVFSSGAVESWYFHDHLKTWEDRFIVSGGLRWLKEEDEELVRVYRVGVIFQPIEDVSLYYSTGINVFPNDGLFTINNGTGETEPRLDQDGTLDEVGIKWIHRFNDNFLLNGSLAYYEQSLTNVETQVGVDSNGFAIFAQGEKDLSSGYELEFGARVNWSAGISDLILTAFTGASLSVEEGRRLQHHPHKKASVLIKHSFAENALKGLTVGGGIHVQGYKRSPRRDIINTPLTATAFMSYKFGQKVSLSLNIDNLTDERYVVQVAQPGLVQSSYGRTFKFGIGYNF